MKPTDLVAAVQSHLNSVIEPPVQVDGDDERPVPSVLIEDWDVNNIQQHNTRYVYSEYNSQDVETARVYHIPYDLRVTFLCRHNEAVDVSTLQDTLREELMKLEINPKQISDEVGRVEAQGGSGVNYQYASPTEAESTQSAVFTSAQVYKRTDFDTLDSIDWEVEIADN